MSLIKGKIIKNISNQYDVLANGVIYHTKARGKFKNMAIVPLVGDNVMVDPEKNYIIDILKRTNELARPHVANIDIGLIICSLKEPDISLYLLDKEICSIELAGIEPVIVFSKIDLLKKSEIKNYQDIKNYYHQIGYHVFENTAIEKLKNYLDSKEVVITGQTGSGKSSFINKLGNLNLKTDKISKALGRGKHTTRHAEIYHIDNIDLIDTPGFSALDLNKYLKLDIQKGFIEFKQFQCYFNDCIHDKEIKCGVKIALEKNLIKESRYDNYLSFLKEIKR